MSRRATPISLRAEDKRTLETWVRSSKTEQRTALRARIILAAARGTSTQEIARQNKVRPTTVSKWRKRFAEKGLVGLADAPRPGARRRYGKETEQRILAKLDEPPPSGNATWSGPLLAEALGDVSADHVWRVLRRYGIHLQRR